VIDASSYGIAAVTWLVGCAGVIANLMVRSGLRSLVVGAVFLCVVTILFVVSLFVISGMVSFP
jgi:predicted membrane channel-forming protein YqfA (hemolysin III family)